MSAPNFDQKHGEGRAPEKGPALPAPSRVHRSDAIEGLPVPSVDRGGFDLPAPSTGSGIYLGGGGESLDAIQFFFHRKAQKEGRIRNARSLRNRVAEIAPPSVQKFIAEPAYSVASELVMEAVERLQTHEQGRDIQRLLSSFPVFGAKEDRIVVEDELEGLLPEHVGIENALIALRTLDLIEPMEVLGEWELTPLGEGVVRYLMLDNDSETSANALDAQTAFITARLVHEPRAAGAFLEASVYLLAHGLLESELGHPTRWGAAMRAIRNAVVVDLERPGSLLEGAGGLRSQDIATLGGMAAVSPLSEGSVPPEMRTLVVVLGAREHIQKCVGNDPARLPDVLLDPKMYEALDRQMCGLKAMAHVAWVTLSRGTSPKKIQETAESLAHAVTGVRPGGMFHPSDFALLTPDHREHLLLLAAAKEIPSFKIEGTLQDARRRLGMVYGQLVEEYPHVSERTRAASRILALHTGYEQHSEESLDHEARWVMEQVEESLGFTNELTDLAMRLQPGLFGKENSSLALHTLVRLCSDVDDPSHTIDHTDTMVAAAEWVAVAERFSSFQTMQEAQLYRYALMEATDRPGFKKPQREATTRMLAHSTSLMTVLAQQDQTRTIPMVEKEILSTMSTPQLMEIIEGGGGRFGVARIPWQENEREQSFRRIIEYSGLRLAFPEEMNVVSRNLLRLLGTHVGPGDPRRKLDVPQKEMLESRVGSVSEELTEADARDGLAFLQSVEAAKASGILRTYSGAGVTVDEAAWAHDNEY